MDIVGARCVLTGASGGIGQAIALELAGRGAELVLTGRRAEPLNDLAAATGGEVLIADLADRAGLDRLAEICRGADILVANAALSGRSTVAEETVEHIDDVIDVNLRAPIILATALAEGRMAAGKGGHIVLVGSIAGLAASADNRMYNATKFGLRGFGLGLRQDLAPHGIGVTLVMPGFIRDAGMFADRGLEVPKVVRTRPPADVARAVVRAVGSNRAEIYVSPFELRLAATAVSLMPGLGATAQRKIGIEERLERGSP